MSPIGRGKTGSPESTAASAATGWNPFEMFFSSGLLIGKCDICNKRLGWKPVLECDDCGLRCVFHSIIWKRQTLLFVL